MVSIFRGTESCCPAVPHLLVTAFVLLHLTGRRRALPSQGREGWTGVIGAVSKVRWPQLP